MPEGLMRMYSYNYKGFRKKWFQEKKQYLDKKLKGREYREWVVKEGKEESE